MSNLKTRNLTGSLLCHKRKERHFVLHAGNIDAIKKSAFVRKTVKDSLFAIQWDENDIRKRTEDYFLSLNAPSPKTAKIQAEEASAQVVRYLNSEDRTPFPAPVRTLDLFGVTVDVAPDFLFKGTRMFERGKGKDKAAYSEVYLEAVMLKTKKPDVTLRGRKQDAGIMTNMELYALLAYVKDMAHEMLEEGTHINVAASFYFLKKDSDSDDNFDQDFFHMEKGKKPNVVTLWDTCVAGDRNLSAVDITYQEQFNMYESGGFDFTGTDTCGKCDFYTSCAYRETPRPSAVNTTNQAKGSLKGITLTEKQKEAIAFRKGIARINAGAGAGKTLVVSLRTASLLKDGVKPEEILLLTFTNAGAAEFKDRIASYTEESGVNADLSKLTSTTFNAFGDMVIRSNYDMLGFDSEPELIDDVQRMSMIAGILKETDCPGLDYKYFDLDMPNRKGALPVTAEVFDIFSRIGNSLKGEDIPAVLNEGLGTDAAFLHPSQKTYDVLWDMYQEYRRQLTERCLVEYSDQEQMIFAVLEKDPGYFARKGYKHIIVDEFQDTNGIQFKVMKALMDTPSFESLMVVGDDSQSIYGFRGSMPEFMVDFAGKLGLPCTDFYLLENHRSTPQIIEFANRINRLNEHRVEKDLVATRPNGRAVEVKTFLDTAKSDDKAVEIIKNRHAAGIPYENIAYIAYTRAELLRLSELLTEENIPWFLASPEPCLENPKIAGAVALASFLNDRSSTKDLFIFGNADKRNRFLEEFDDKGVTDYFKIWADIADKIMEDEDEEQFMAILYGLDDGNNLNGPTDEVFASFLDSVEKCRGFYGKLDYCLNFAKYGAKQGKRREMKYPGVVLTTAHSSKGLEWPVVINCLTKYDSKDFTEEEAEERRRLLFVSATRARDELYIIGKENSYGSASRGSAVKNRYLEESKEAVK